MYKLLRLRIYLIYFCIEFITMTQNNPSTDNKSIINFLVDDRYRIFRHALLLLWLYLMFVNANFIREYQDFYRWFVFMTVYGTFVIMIYVNMYLLVPRFFFKGKYLLYLMSLLGTGIFGLYFLIYIIGSFFEKYHLKIGHPPFQINQYFSSVNIIIILILLTTSIKLLQRWIIDSNRMTELQTLTLNFELNELKNQITPHFLFNMLNNIKALIRNNPQKATDIIVKLSDLLRYQLYESSSKNVLLTSEIKFIRNFLSLEKIRRDHFNFIIRSNDEILQLKSIEIPPNLFMPFVENAIKHSSENENDEINISIKFFISEKELSFLCINSISSEEEKRHTPYGGLGLKNITRRLQLLYEKEDYELTASATLNHYTVNLKIPI